MTTSPIPYFHDLAPGSTGSKSWSGAGVAGSNGDRSWSGHGTSTAVLKIDDNITPGGFPCTHVGCYVYLASGSSGGAICSFSNGVDVYWSFFIDGSGNLTSKAILYSVSYNYVVTIGSFTYDQWNWCATGFQADTNSGQLALYAFLYGLGNLGTSASFAAVHLPAHHLVGQTIGCSFGDGTDLNGNFTDMANSHDSRRSKLVIAQRSSNAATPPYTNVLRPPPYNDASAAFSGLQQYYLGRQTPGATGSITESAAGSLNLSGTYTVWGDGPFAG